MKTARARLAPQILAALILTGLGGIGGCAGNKADDARTMLKRDVPGPALDAINRESNGARISEYKQIVEDGKTLYIGEYTRNGRDVEIEVYADGKVCCVETELAMNDLPANVRAIVDREVGTGTVTDLEEVRSVAKGMTYYAVEAKVAGGELELEVGTDGAVLKKELVEKKN